MNHFVDMDQSEKNGIVISVASAIFALYGYYVNIACANEFLCTREIFKFKKLFENLKVNE